MAVVPEPNELPTVDVRPPRAFSPWTADRQELKAWFDRNALTLGELYQGAVEMIHGNQIPGWTWFVCHAVREIRNRLPDAIAGPKAGRNLNYKNRLDAIVKAWSATGLSLDGSTSIANMAEGPEFPASADVPLTRELVGQIAELLQDHHDARERPLESATRLFEAVAPENAQLRKTLTPIVQHWIETTNWFVQYVHVRNNGDAFPCEDLSLKFAAFEGVLKSLVREFFAGIREIDAILQDANA